MTSEITRQKFFFENMKAKRIKRDRLSLVDEKLKQTTNKKKLCSEAS